VTYKEGQTLPGPPRETTTQMAREIAEQPVALERTLDTLLPRRAEIARLAVGRHRLLLIARGSSDNAAIYARYLAEVHAGVPASLAAPSVATLYDARLDLQDTVTIAVSQSGSTQEIAEAMAWAQRCGSATIAVTNVEGSPLAEIADIALLTEAGPEKAVPATKSYTTQVAALAVAVDAFAPTPGLLDAGFAEVPAAAQAMLESDPGDVEAMVDALARTDEVLTSGRGLCFGTTLEVARSADSPTPTSSTARSPSWTTSSSPCWWPARPVPPCRGSSSWPAPYGARAARCWASAVTRPSERLVTWPCRDPP
jgi:glucosamine--fructose-6-phosphate aminotransferase (isomerizing)